MELICANDALQKRCCEINYQAWGNLLSLQQYLDRERILRSEKWCQNIAHTWILQSDKSEIVAACETYKMKSYLLGEKNRVGNTIAIGSVFVQPHFRGRGYASKLIELLLKNECEMEKDVHAFILYAENCERVYRKNGFIAVESKEWILPAKKIDYNYEVVEYITRQELYTEFDTFFEVPAKKFIVWPDLNQIKWHFQRQDLYASFLKKKIPEFIAARINETQVIWAIDFKANKLRIILEKIESSSDFLLLIEAAQDLAEKFGLDGVSLWRYKSNRFLDKEFQNKGLLVERSDSVAMIKLVETKIKPNDWDYIQKGIWV